VREWNVIDGMAEQNAKSPGSVCWQGFEKILETTIPK
jgi:hypothetical protein